MACHELGRASYSYPEHIYDWRSVPVQVINCMTDLIK